MKKITMTAARPRVAAAVDEWVMSRLGSDEEAALPAPAPVVPAEPTKRLTFDVPASMHRRLKLGATARDQNIADVLRELIDREFPAP